MATKRHSNTNFPLIMMGTVAIILLAAGLLIGTEDNQGFLIGAQDKFEKGETPRPSAPSQASNIASAAQPAMDPQLEKDFYGESSDNDGGWGSNDNFYDHDGPSNHEMTASSAAANLPKESPESPYPNGQSFEQGDAIGPPPSGPSVPPTRELVPSLH